MKNFILSFILCLPTLAFANCLESYESLPILAGGRIKPLIAHAQEEIKFLTGSSTVAGKSAVEAYCQLSLSFLQPSILELQATIEHNDVKTILKMPLEEKKISYQQLVGHEFDIRAQYFAHKDLDALKRSLEKHLRQIQTYKEILSGEDWKLAQTGSNGELEWTALNKLVTETGQLEKLAILSQESFIKQKGDHYLLELTYVKSHIFQWSMLVSLIALSLLILMKNPQFGLAMAVATVLVELVGVTMRVMISGRAPITNMYETVMFSGLGALMVALIVGHLRKEKVFVIAGLSYNFLCLLMMNFANNMLSPSIAPLVPVLRDNFWLSTHVTTVILSYGALALSWILANISLYKMRFRGLSTQELRFEVQTINACVKVGVVLLAAGIILGGVWADYSWGRFWGWDPKETWSLIVLLIYTAILHGRHTQWINDARFIPLIALSFLSVMMAWFGVNYILASGLHSYGFSEGGAIFLATFFITQIVFLVITTVNVKKKKPAEVR